MATAPIALDPTTYFALAVALPLFAGLLITLVVLHRTRRTPLTLAATAVLLLFLFGPLSLAGALVGAGAWWGLNAKGKRRAKRATL